MQRNTFKHRRDGMPAIGICEAHTFGQERYDDLLRQAEQYRLGLSLEHPHTAESNYQSTLQVVESPLARLLIWARILKVNSLRAS